MLSVASKLPGSSAYRNSGCWISLNAIFDWHSSYILLLVCLVLVKQMCTRMGHYFSYLIWATIWRINPLFTSGICDNLFTKHSNHMAYISKPLVRKFRILWIRRLDLFSFEIFQTILRNRAALIPIFFASSNVYFHFTNIKWRHWFDMCVLPDDLSTYFEC